eukprot:gb/GECG01003279.1/.p1 GENE.gb/GECG01003279.1/~~gb/GECG01003279.1/.p1  ORF type:complete len:450 (+),score=68.06 gb/GECG01003279.1/:1-1350(+)
MYQYTAMAQEPDVNVDLLEEVQSMLRSSSSTRVRQAAERVSEYRPRVEERDQAPQNLRRGGEADNGASDYHFWRRLPTNRSLFFLSRVDTVPRYHVTVRFQIPRVQSRSSTQDDNDEPLQEDSSEDDKLLKNSEKSPKCVRVWKTYQKHFVGDSPGEMKLAPQIRQGPCCTIHAPSSFGTHSGVLGYSRGFISVSGGERNFDGDPEALKCCHSVVDKVRERLPDARNVETFYEGCYGNATLTEIIVNTPPHLNSKKLLEDTIRQDLEQQNEQWVQIWEEQIESKQATLPRIELERLDSECMLSILEKGKEGRDSNVCTAYGPRMAEYAHCYLLLDGQGTIVNTDTILAPDQESQHIDHGASPLEVLRPSSLSFWLNFSRAHCGENINNYLQVSGPSLLLNSAKFAEREALLRTTQDEIVALWGLSREKLSDVAISNAYVDRIQEFLLTD